jgi:sugar phosphate isomerase/epimerase
MANRLSLAPLTLSDASPLELIDAAKAGGFDAVTLRMIGAPGIETAPPLADDRAQVAAIGRRLNDTGIAAFSASGIWLTPDFAADRFERALATAAELGAAHFLAVGFDSDWPRLVANFAALCALAARYRLGIAVEFMPYIPVRTAADGARLIREAGQPNAGLVIDALHLARSDGTPADIAAIDPALLFYVQLCDAPRVRPATMERREESLHNRLYPGEGELPLFALMDALPRDIAIDLETPCAADAHLPLDERARRAGDATRRFLHAYRARGA